MAISDAYATPQEYRDRAGATDSGHDSVIALDLTAVSRWIEERTGRFFNKDAADATRYYLPETQSDTLWVDDLSGTPTSITMDEDGDGDYADETALAATDYQLRPRNAAVGPEAEPFTHIVLTPWGKKGLFAAGLEVRVVAKFGWPAVPELVKVATIEFARLLRLETPRATARITELEGVIRASGPAQGMLEHLLSRYSRRALLV